MPEVTALFWLTKVMTTGMGETISDELVHRFFPPLVVGIAGLALLAAMVCQFRAQTYVPWKYWLACSMVSVFGTMVADIVHVQLGVPYFASTMCFVVVLALCFGVWRRSEGTLSIHSITTRRREVFYWATVMTTFALGTAVGDMTAITLKLGYFSSGLLFSAAIAVPAALFGVFRRSEVLAFWTAYVLTRPLGASFADWIGAPHSRGGLGLGFGGISVLLGVAIVAVVGYASAIRSRSDDDRQALAT